VITVVCKLLRRGRFRGERSTIITNDLIALLFNAPNVRIVVFADDIMITIQGPSLSATLTTLQSTLQTIEDWCKEHRLEISKDKSALMLVLTRNREEYKRHPTIVAWGINVVSKMRYLGIILDCKLDWYSHKQYLENKLLRRYVKTQLSLYQFY